MRKLLVVLLAVFSIELLPSLCYSQISDFSEYLEFNNIGGGARAAGMGGAYIGLAEGEYAYSWNPGALSFAEKNYIGIQFSQFSDKTTQPFALYSPFLSDYAYRDVEVKREHLNLDFGGFTVPFSFMNREWAVAGGYRNVLDLGYEYETAAILGGTNTFSQADGVNAISMAINGKVMQGVGVGITINTYVRGTESNLWASKYAIYQSSTEEPPDTIDYWENQSSHYDGVNFDLGMAAAFGMFKGGIVIHTPFDLQKETKLSQTFMTQPLPVGVVNRITTTVNIPIGYSAGVAFAPFEKFTIAADLDMRQMSKSDIDIDFESNLYADATTDPEWEDLTQFRIGAEYVFDAGFARLPLRAGFRNQPSVDKEYLGNGNDPEYGDQINTNIITFGSGLQFEKAWIDFAYQFGSSSNTAHVIFADVDKNTEIKRNYSRLIVSAGMYF